MEENKITRNDIVRREAIALIEFVERVSKEGATPEELAILPAVAGILTNLPV